MAPKCIAHDVVSKPVCFLSNLWQQPGCSYHPRFGQPWALMLQDPGVQWI